MRLRAWIKKAEIATRTFGAVVTSGHRCQVLAGDNGGASVTLTLVVPNASPADLDALREAMTLPITEMGYPAEVVIEGGKSGEVIVTDN